MKENNKATSNDTTQSTGQPSQSSSGSQNTGNSAFFAKGKVTVKAPAVEVGVEGEINKVEKVSCCIL